jgi:chorismate mutase
VIGLPVFVRAGASAEEKTTMKEVREESQKALKPIKEYSLAQHDQVVQKVEAVLHDLDSRIDRLQIREEKNWDEMNQATR